MLMLTRKVGDSIIIGDNQIKITVVCTKKSQVRIGIEAPRELSIHREEIFKLIQAQKSSANNSLPITNIEFAAD